MMHKYCSLINNGTIGNMVRTQPQQWLTVCWCPKARNYLAESKAEKFQFEWCYGGRGLSRIHLARFFYTKTQLDWQQKNLFYWFIKEKNSFGSKAEAIYTILLTAALEGSFGKAEITQTGVNPGCFLSPFHHPPSVFSVMSRSVDSRSCWTRKNWTKYPLSWSLLCLPLPEWLRS